MQNSTDNMRMKMRIHSQYSVIYLYPVSSASIKYHVREFRLFQYAIAMDMNVKYTTNRTKYICQASKQRNERK